MTWWWLSFYGRDDTCKGVILCEARCRGEAVQVAAMLGGHGRTRAQSMSKGERDLFYVPEDMRYRLLKKEEAQRLDAMWQRFMSQETIET
jgi:hypothetical protein